MSESTEACPFHLLYTDQRGWSVDERGELPTRHVAGGNRGMNLLIIEVILDILRPMVTMVKGGKEVISTEDSLARFEDVNITVVGWTDTSWWEGKSYGNLLAFVKCW